MGKHMPLVDRLHGVQAARRRMANKEDLAGATLAEHADHLKVVDGDLIGSFATTIGTTATLLCRISILAVIGASRVLGILLFGIISMLVLVERLSSAVRRLSDDGISRESGREATVHG